MTDHIDELLAEVGTIMQEEHERIQQIEISLERYRSRVYELEQLIIRYHALLDTWDLDIPEHVPFSIAEAAEQEKMDLQQEASKIKSM